MSKDDPKTYFKVDNRISSQAGSRHECKFYIELKNLLEIIKPIDMEDLQP